MDGAGARKGCEVSVRGLILSAAGGQQYTALNPLDKGSNIALSGANLTGTSSGPGLARSIKAIGVGERKYWEVFIQSASGAHTHGVTLASAATGDIPGSNVHGLSWWPDGSIVNNGSTLDVTGGYGNGDVLGFDFNKSTGLLRLLKNGVFQQNYTLGSATHPAFGANGAGVVATFNFGPTMAYSIPSGASLITA